MVWVRLKFLEELDKKYKLKWLNKLKKMLEKIPDNINKDMVFIGISVFGIKATKTGTVYKVAHAYETMGLPRKRELIFYDEPIKTNEVVDLKEVMEEALNVENEARKDWFDKAMIVMMFEYKEVE